MGGKRSISLRLTWKLTQQLSHSVLNTCWKFNWVWMQFEEFLLNELDFYLAIKKKKKEEILKSLRFSWKITQQES